MSNRIEALKSGLEKSTAAIITDDANRFYLTGMKSSAGVLVVTKEKASLLMDFRYYNKAAQTVKGAEVILLSNLKDQLNDLLLSADEIFFECDRISLCEYQRYREMLPEKRLSVDNRIGKRLALMRSVKSADEIKSIKMAQEITDKAFNNILNEIKPGKTERDIALSLEFFMRSSGSEGVAFDTITVSGGNSALPHGVPTDKKIENGDFLTMDFGARVNGYCSDMTRTVAVGAVTDEQKEVYKTVLEAQKRALEMIKPGAVCRDIDKAARDYIDGGYKGCFGHGLGHSVGIEIHESPCFNTRDETKLAPGHVITVEPGIYLENRFGVRIEDMIIVGRNGYENITKSPKELIVL